MKRGYLRVSTKDQNLALQHDALKKEGVDVFYAEKISGATRSRPELDRLLADLQPGDSVVVWRFDRLGRSLTHLLELIERFKRDEVGLVSITERVDTTTPSGRLFFSMAAAFAEFERSVSAERREAGIAARRARGLPMGPQRRLSSEQLAYAHEQIYLRGESVSHTASFLRVSRSTLWRSLKAKGLYQ